MKLCGRNISLSASLFSTMLTTIFCRSLRCIGILHADALKSFVYTIVVRLILLLCGRKGSSCTSIVVEPGVGQQHQPWMSGRHESVTHAMIMQQPGTEVNLVLLMPVTPVCTPTSVVV